MEKVFEIYLYACGFIISIISLLGLIAVILNVVVYFYQSFVGFNTFEKFLRKYHSEMKKEKIIKADASKAFEKKGGQAMTDKEKKAIKFNLKQVRESYEIHTCNTFKKAIDEALNLIEKQDKRINELEKALIDDDYKHKQETKKKDRIINRMADELWNEFYLTYMNDLSIHNQNELIEYFKKEEV